MQRLKQVILAVTNIQQERLKLGVLQSDAVIIQASSISMISSQSKRWSASVFSRFAVIDWMYLALNSSMSQFRAKCMEGPLKEMIEAVVCVVCVKVVDVTFVSFAEDVAPEKDEAPVPDMCVRSLCEEGGLAEEDGSWTVSPGIFAIGPRDWDIPLRQARPADVCIRRDRSEFDGASSSEAYLKVGTIT